MDKDMLKEKVLIQPESTYGSVWACEGFSVLATN